MDFLRLQLRQNSTVMASFCRQKVNVRRGLLRELYGVREGVRSAKKAGMRREGKFDRERKKKMMPITQAVSVSVVVFYK